MPKQIKISKQRYPYSTQQCPYKSSFRRRTEFEDLFVKYPELFYPYGHLPIWLEKKLFNYINFE